MTTLQKIKVLASQANLTHTYEFAYTSFHRGGKKAYYAFDVSDNLGKSDPRTIHISYTARDAVNNFKMLITDKKII